MITLYIRGNTADAIQLSERMNMPLLYLEPYEPAPNYKLVKALVLGHHIDNITMAYREGSTQDRPCRPGEIVFYVADNEKAGGT